VIILSLRTDNPQAELGLYDDDRQIAYDIWQAHRQLAETIHTRLATILKTNGYEQSQVEGVAAYSGPGSFTGLRIGLSVANAFAASNNLPIAGATGENWQQTAITELRSPNAQKLPLVPDYGSPVHITPQRH
jgi:tRNA threonylcarbamoyladenosine biosynthesis protein TsaB